ncbi:response regulator transcription factor [Colwellia psychrerythraea]|uniref:Two component transcriptional regulator, winged helix family n=1 Tax=Colwellia psychrerythraea TaxID=28229 RepID=A0A099KIX5_COLPS|nr:response regulator transcription factor [Colwellia psychrerythraea]KGJ90779.1 two component transcriptional regulator, winged helix family [Colwellia psychrerythraea]
MLILLVEDESDLAELTIDFLETLNIECDYAFDGANALTLIEKNHYDVIVLDVNMPRMDGFSVCEKVRSLGIATPIIFLTAHDSLADKLNGFSLGADDYLTKPFELEELAVRIQVLAKRETKAEIPDLFALNTLSIDFQQRCVSRSGRLIALSPTQWQLLGLLAKNSPHIVDRITIEDEIWPDQTPSKDMLKTLIFRLRNLIDNANEPKLIHTIRGAGISLKELA